MWKIQEKSYAWVSLETEKLQVVQPSDVALGKQAKPEQDLQAWTDGGQLRRRGARDLLSGGQNEMQGVRITKQSVFTKHKERRGQVMEKATSCSRTWILCGL